MSVTPLPFSEFVDTTDSEQRWQIFSAIQGQTGLADNVTIVGPTDSNGYVNVDVKTQIGVGTVGAGGVPSSAFLVGYNAGNGNLNSVGLYSPLPIQFGNSVSLPTGSNVIGGVTLPQSSSASVTSFTSTSSAQVLASNANRKGIVLYNQGAGSVYILLGTGTASSTNFSVGLGTGDNVTITGFTGALQGIFTTAGTLQVTELS